MGPDLQGKGSSQGPVTSCVALSSTDVAVLLNNVDETVVVQCVANSSNSAGNWFI